VRRALLLVALGVAWAGLVQGVAHLLIGDDDWDWAEFGVRAASFGFTVLVIGTVVVPRRYRAVWPAVARALSTGRLPDRVDTGLWRGALVHQRQALWVWRAVVPAVLGLAAVGCVAGALLAGPGSAWAVLFFVAAGSGVGAVVSARWAGRRRQAIDGLLDELAGRDVRAG
jgi:hypothetical protein